MSKKIQGTERNWDDGILGASLEHAEPSPNSSLDIDATLAMQSISIRLDKTLIEDLKVIADINNLGYQPLIRRYLTRAVEGEMKQLIRNNASLLKKKGVKSPTDSKSGRKRA